MVCDQCEHTAEPTRDSYSHLPGFSRDRKNILSPCNSSIDLPFTVHLKSALLLLLLLRSCQSTVAESWLIIMNREPEEHLCQVGRNTVPLTPVPSPVSALYIGSWPFWAGAWISLEIYRVSWAPLALEANVGPCNKISDGLSRPKLANVFQECLSWFQGAKVDLFCLLILCMLVSKAVYSQYFSRKAVATVAVHMDKGVIRNKTMPRQNAKKNLL